MYQDTFQAEFCSLTVAGRPLLGTFLIRISTWYLVPGTWYLVLRTTQMTPAPVQPVATFFKNPVEIWTKNRYFHP